jgi:glycerol-3-phosphate dehydrogenase
VTYHQLYEPLRFGNLAADDVDRTTSIALSRKEILGALNEKKYFDLVIVGGGIHGAMAAYLGALNGFSVALFEAHDYASATSSRSSKMLHGGLRYLEHFDFAQVREGIRDRDTFLSYAPHLATLEPFFVPLRVPFIDRAKLFLGLSLYTLFSRGKTPPVRYLTHAPSKPQGVSCPYGGYEFWDGLMDDARIVVETIGAARREGALCCNYARVKSLGRRTKEGVLIEWRDERGGESSYIHAGAVLNCAGPWAPILHPTHPPVRYSRGIHLIFNVPWRSSSLLLPLGGRGRYYFVWPHQYGTLVGTTEKMVADAEHSPVASVDEIEELLSRIRSDLPDSGLSLNALHGAFCGVRTLPLRSASAHRRTTASLSRRHYWIEQERIFTLVGGKFTSAASTAFEGIVKVSKAANLSIRLSPLGSQRLAASQFDDATRSFIARSHEKDCRTRRAVLGGLRRIGAALGKSVSFDDDTSALLGDKTPIFKGEIERILTHEQVETVEDLIERRIGLYLAPDCGLSLVAEMLPILEAHSPEKRWRDSAKEYEDKVRIRNEPILLLKSSLLKSQERLFNNQLKKNDS